MSRMKVQFVLCHNVKIRESDVIIFTTAYSWRRCPPMRRIFPTFILLFLFGTVIMRWKFKDSAFADKFRFFQHVPDKYIGSHFKYCNGIANQMYRYASLYSIGKQIGREPYIDSTLECTPRILPELAAAMPDFFGRLNLIASFWRVFQRFLKVPTPKTQVKRVEFAKNCCKHDNVSKLVGLHPGNKYLKVNSNLLQSYKFFHHNKAKLRQIFEFSDNLKQYVERFAAQLFGNDTHHKFCVHTRLGDFKHHSYLLPSKHGFTNPAIQFVGNEIMKNFTNISVVLLGTDKDFVEKISIPKNMFMKSFRPMDMSRTEELYFGTRYCDTYLITASGSTFAWWMAYLMPEEAQHRVFYNYLASKNKTFGKDTYDFDTFPQEWKRLRLFNVSRIGYEPRWNKDIKDDQFSMSLHRK